MKLIAALGTKKDVQNIIAVPYADRTDALFGWISKRGKRGTRARDRWFVLTQDNCLYYFDDATAVFARGAVFLEQASFVKEDAMLTASLRAPFAVTVAKAGLELHRDRVYDLEFKSTHDFRDWSAALGARIAKLQGVSAVRKTGWLEKRGLVNTDWARRYFIVAGPLLIYLKDEYVCESQGCLLLSAVVRADTLSRDDPAFDESRSFAFRVQHQSRDLVCAACSEEEMRGWLALLSERGSAGTRIVSAGDSVLRSPRDRTEAGNFSSSSSGSGAIPTLSPRAKPTVPSSSSPRAGVAAPAGTSPRAGVAAPAGTSPRAGAAAPTGASPRGAAAPTGTSPREFTTLNGSRISK